MSLSEAENRIASAPFSQNRERKPTVTVREYLPEQMLRSAQEDQIEEERALCELADERDSELESQLYLDEHPEEREEAVEAQEVTVKREMLKTAITRIENAARTAEDFENVVKSWDKLEQNEARRLGDHEVSRGDVPLEYGKAMDGAIFPAFFVEQKWMQLMRGNYVDLIHDCPFEMDELVTDPALVKLFRRMKDDHKEIFYWHFIRQLSCAEVGRIRNQSDRNIRKTRGVIVRKLQGEFAAVLCKREAAGYRLTPRQRVFLERVGKDTLDGQKIGC